MTMAHFSVIELDSLHWPSSLRIPSRRFRLFIAADVTGISTEMIADFAHNALKSGMVYFCSWGPDCERFHDIVDELVVADELGEGMFVALDPDDVIMTTWHDDESLEEALDFFVNYSCPTDGFAPDSDYWLAFCVNNSAWTEKIRKRLDSANAAV